MPRRNAVVTLADQKQFPPAVFVAQRLMALNPRADTDVLLGSNHAPSLGAARDFDPTIDQLDLTDAAGGRMLPPRGYLSPAAYLRLFLPRLLHDRYARILYLDADVSIESDRVFQLFDLDLHGHAVAAVRDMTVPFVAHSINANELNATLGLKGDERFVGLFGAKYLNSGVLLIDVDTYRQRKIESDAMRLVETSMRSPALVDQSLFNAVLRGKWLEMSPSFNMITRAWASFIRDFAPPAIVHFTGQTKPWHHAFADEHPLRSQLRAFLKTSPWSDFILRENPITLGPNSRPPAEPQAPSWGPKGMEALLNYLRTTAFADVEQGLTTLNYAALPA